MRYPPMKPQSLVALPSPLHFTYVATLARLNMRKVTRKEVKDKNYVIMNNMVYDISQFIDEVSETKKNVI